MSAKRFVIRSTATELELYDGDVQIGEFPHFEWVAKSVDSVVDLLNEQQAIIKDLERKLQVCSAHLLSDECCLTDGQIREIIKEMTNE